MKVKKFTITSTQLNTHAPIDTTVSVALAGTQHLYANQLIVINNSGLATPTMILLSASEVAEYALSSAMFDTFPLATGRADFDEIPKTEKLKVYLAGGSATGNIDFYFLNYSPS
jgi:hypothetical protein